MPWSSMRKGYSLVPCAEPRYLTTRSRRVVTWSCTRLSSRMTQSETYSSSPCAGQLPRAALAGDHGGDAAVLEPTEQPPQLGAQDAVVGEAGEQRLRACRGRRVSRPPCRWRGRGGRTGPRGRTRRSPRFRCARPHVVDAAASFRQSGRAHRNRAKRRWRRGPPRPPRSVISTPASPNCRAPLDQEGHGEERLAAAGATADQRRPPLRQASEGELVEATDPGWRLG